jgi:general secretion pathway protein G
MMSRRKEKGFSLIELIIVLVILGLLAAIVTPKIFDELRRSKQKIARIQIGELDGALEKYAFDNGRFPSTEEGLEALVENTANLASWRGSYLKTNHVPLDPWDHAYAYRCPGINSDFDVFSFGPDGMEGGEGENEDITNQK